MRARPRPILPADFVIETYADLVQACRARRYELGLSQLDVDAIAGWADGYAAKLEMSDSVEVAPNARAIGRVSLPLILGALGAQLVLVPKGSQRTREAIPMAERGRRGAKAYRERVSPERRAEIAREAARARWARPA